MRNHEILNILILLAVLVCFPSNSMSQGYFEQVSLLAGESKLLIGDQFGSDIVISLYDGQSTLNVDHPLGNTGPEVLLLGPYAEDINLKISVSEKGQNESDNYSIRIVDIDPSPSEISILKNLSIAGELANSNNENSIRLALEYYQTASDTNAVQVLGSEYQNYAQYLEAEILHKLYDLQSALDSLSEIPAVSCAIPQFCYKQRLLEYRIYSLQDNTDYLLQQDRISRLIDSIENVGELYDVRSDLASANYEFGMALILGNQFDQGLHIMESALELAENVGDLQLIGTIEGGLATHDFFSGEIVSALGHLQSSVENLKQGGNDRSITYALLNLNFTYRQLGEFNLAQKALHDALQYADGSFDKSLPREIYGSLGGLYLTIGDYSRAEQFTRLAIDFDLSIDRNPVRTDDARNQLGEILRNQDRAVDAISEHLKVLEYYSLTENLQEISLVNEQLALDYLELGNLQRAKEHFDAAYLEQETEGVQIGSTQQSKNLSRLLIAEEKYDEAIEMLLEARRNVNTELEYTENLIEISSMLMQLYSKLSNLEEVERYGDELVDLIFDIQSQLEFNRLGPVWSSKSNDMLTNYSVVLIEEYLDSRNSFYAEKALLLLERSRSSNLLKQRLANSSRDAFEGEQSLSRQLTEISRKRASVDVTSDEYDQISREYFRALELYQRQFIPNNHAAFSSAYAVSDLQDMVSATSVAIEFLCVPGNSCYAFFLDGSNLDVVKLGEYSTISLLVDAVQTALRSNQNDTLAMRRLGELVFGKLDLDNRSEIMIVNDFPLNTIPLSVLSVANNTEIYEAAVEKFAIANIPSIISLESQPAARNYSVELAVLANPVFSSEAIPQIAQNSDKLRGWMNELEPLPWSAVEAENLEEIYTGEEVRIYTGADANRRSLFDEETRNAKIVHIASHAYFNEYMSDLVGIALSAETMDDRGSGDFVTLADIQAAQFRSEIVIISGCETGQGEYLAGEGDMSLARGFLAQGVNHVVSTLWPVSDRASAEFMKLFHLALYTEGQSVRQALRTAQIKLAEIPQYRQPFYWAPYFLTSAINE